MTVSAEYNGELPATKGAPSGFVAFLETAADGDEYVAFLPAAGLAPRQVRFLALTQEARRWLSEHDWPHEWVWRHVDEAEIKTGAWREADRLVDVWEGEDCWPDVFTRRCVSPEFWRLFYHAFASERLLTDLMAMLRSETVLMLPVESRPLSSFRVKYVGSNDVFRAVLQGFVRHHQLRGRVLRSTLSLRLRNQTRAARAVIRQILDDLRDRRRQAPELEELESSHPSPTGVAHADVLIANWRGDMERTFRMPDLLPHLAADGLSGAHLVWAPSADHLSGKAPVGHAVYRARLAIPPVGCYVSRIAWPAIRTWRTLAHRMGGFLRHAGFAAVAAAPLGFEYLHLAFHARRESFMARSFIATALRRFQPKVLVASDVDVCMFRAFLLEAGEGQVVTVSVNHGYYVWDISRHCWVADVCCANGPAVARHMAPLRGRCLKPVVTGNAVLAELPSDVTGRATRRKRIVIVTSSFFGLWSSLSSVEAEDGGGIERLARLLSEQPDWDVVIKSHPVADFHALYDAIVTRVAHPNLTHVRTYWPNEEFAVCTAAVVCGGVTGAILQLQRAGVPAIYLADRLAEAWSRELHFDYAGVGWAVASPDEACEAVRRLATDDAFRAEVRARGRQFLDGYRGDSANAMQTFATLLSKLAHGDSPPSPVSSEVG